MPIDAELLHKLRCPKSRTPLRAATAEELARLNEKISSGALRTTAGEPVSSAIDEGLVPEGEPIVYPVREGVPVLLVEEAIPLPEA